MTIEVTSHTIHHFDSIYNKRWGISYSELLPGMIIIHRLRWNVENIDINTVGRHLINEPLMEYNKSEDPNYFVVRGIMRAAKWRVLEGIAKRNATRLKARKVIAELGFKTEKYTEGMEHEEPIILRISDSAILEA